MKKQGAEPNAQMPTKSCMRRGGPNYLDANPSPHHCNMFHLDVCIFISRARPHALQAKRKAKKEGKDHEEAKAAGRAAMALVE